MPSGTAPHTLFAVVAAATAAVGAGVVISAAATEPLPPPVLSASVAEGEVVPLDAVPSVTAGDGTLSQVRLVADDGEEWPVAVSPTATRWSGPAELPPATTFTLAATAVNPEGLTTDLSRSFTTAPPAQELTTDVYPYGDQVVGVGHPLSVRLSDDVVGPAERAAVESSLVVSTSQPIGQASWHWIDDDELQYRPEDFWPAHTQVTLDVGLRGVKAGEDLWGLVNRQVRFHTGRSLVVNIDDDSKSATVVQDGQVVRTMPVSLGKPGYLTRSGTKVIMSTHRMYRMRSSTLGVFEGPEAYDIEVPYAMRITNSGEFLHGAPWNGSIGRSNRSHGCTNLKMADAAWLHDNVLIGDPVVTTGTGKDMERDNGMGGVWNVSWDEWRAASALPG
jgi:lipoprotein-anchoring transpeptidase ErfK/SrfK